MSKHRLGRPLTRLAGWLVVAQLAIAGAFLFDRAPPVEYGGNAVARLSDDGLLDLSFEVERVRFCDLVLVSRHLAVRGGFRFYLADQSIRAADLRTIADEFFGIVRLKIVVPVGLSLQGAQYVATASYVCNPTHRIWPIDVSYRVPIELPKEGK